MAGAIKVDLRSVRKAYRAMERAGGNVRKVWQGLRRPLRDDQREHMRAQKGSKGARWKPLASSTIERRLSRGGRAGKFTKRGKLKKAAVKKLGRLLGPKLVSGAKVKIERNQMSITSKAGVVAGVHQKGGTVGRGARVPKREFMYISDSLSRRASKALAKHIADAFNKGG